MLDLHIATQVVVCDNFRQKLCTVNRPFPILILTFANMIPGEFRRINIHIHEFAQHGCQPESLGKYQALTEQKVLHVTEMKVITEGIEVSQISYFGTFSKKICFGLEKRKEIVNAQTIVSDILYLILSKTQNDYCTCNLIVKLRSMNNGQCIM